ncbi:MAG: hypothetical protein GXO93_07455 [FCB group bacterium]|nr:hypothetical protein [FCB group bacterium]
MKTISMILVTVLLSTIGYASELSQKKILLHVISSPLAWSDSQLEQKLTCDLSRWPAVRVVATKNKETLQPAFPNSYYNIDSLINWGREIGGRYLMVVKVTKEGLERHKSFHLPLVFHKYETVGIIEGEIRFIDLKRGALLMAEPFSVTQKGPRIFQATMDDDINDPDLHLTAPAKIAFFDELEKKLSKQLSKRVRKLVGVRF